MFTTRTTQLDALLAIICEELQLPPSLYVLAGERYRAVGEWLAAPESELAVFRPKIYPQGSFRIGTTVRPLSGNEFDLDLVCELQLGELEFPPLAVLNLVEGRLRQHRDYAPMLERKRRCLCLSYANEFHLDILPARPVTPPVGTRVLIPDRKIAAWLRSNPKGYAAWFEGQSTLLLEAVRKAAAEPLPDHENAMEKSPLQRSVQLLKRWRDVRYEKDIDAAPRSIVLTTLAGLSATGSASTHATLGGVISKIAASITQTSSPLRVVNPAEPNEVLSEQWERDPKTYRLFATRISELHERWLAVDTSDIEDVARTLSALFGEPVTQRAFKRLTAEQVEPRRREGALGVSRARGSLSIAPVAGVARITRNTFYGDR